MARARHAIMLWAWLACAMLTGFALFAVLLFWLEVSAVAYALHYTPLLTKAALSAVAPGGF